mgnify:CR=1 FL=1
MSMNLVTLLYLVASVCFIQALKGLSHPTTSIRGNIFGMSGMAIAVLTTAALIVQLAADGGTVALGGVPLSDAPAMRAPVSCIARATASAWKATSGPTSFAATRR